MDPNKTRNLIAHPDYREVPVRLFNLKDDPRGSGSATYSRRSGMTWLNLVSFLHGLGVFGSFTILPVYMRDLGGTDFLVSLSMALFYLVRGSLNFLSGPLSDSSGRRKLITLALALFSLSHVCYALSRAPTAILASIALQATAAGLYWPVAFALVSGLSGPGEGPHNIGRFLLALGVGGVAGSWLGGIVADVYSPKATFWLGAVILAVACGTFASFVPEGRNPGGGRFRLRDVLSVPSEVRLPSLLAAGASIVWAVFNVGMPLWLRDLGASYSFIGGTRAVASGANLGVVASAPFIIGRSGFRTSLSSYLLLCGLTMVGVCASSDLLASAVLFSAFWGGAGMEVVGWTSLVEYRSPGGRVGASMGMLRGLRDMFTLGYLLAFGALTQWVDIRLAFGFVALVLLGLSVTVWTHLNPQRREVCRSSL